MLVLTLLACADDVDQQACDVLVGDEIHALVGSTDPGLEEAGAAFHMEAHRHIITLDALDVPLFIWSEGGVGDVSFYTDADLVSATHDGESAEIGETQANHHCSADLPTSFSLHAEEGRWEFQLDGSGEYSWLALPHEDDGHGDHEH